MSKRPIVPFNKPSMMSFSFLSFFLALAFSSLSCHKEFLPDKGAIIDTVGQDDGVTDTIPKDTTTPPPPQNSGNVIEVGTGTGGNLIIDGSGKNYGCNTTIRIKGGTYGSVSIKNITGQNGCPVKITNNGLVQFAANGQGITLSNLRYVMVSGDGTPGIDKGFAFANSRNTAVSLVSSVNDFTLQHISLKSISAYGAISYEGKLIYDGSENSYLKNLKFLHITCDNTQTLIRFKSTDGVNPIDGLIRNIEIADVNFKNSPTVGSVVVLGAVEDFNIHNNTIQSINQNNDNHNGIFYVQGNGKFYNNIVRDHEGNAIRAWVYSIGTSPKEVLIYNNIVVNSRAYSAFEVQAFDRDMAAGKTTFANVKVYNNTCGNLKPKGNSFPAQVLDLYSLRGGTCQILNNVGYTFTLVGQNNTNYFWNKLNDTDPSVNANNKYYSTYAGAGFGDDQKFIPKSSSPLKHAGKSVASLTTDIYGNARGANPTIGAVE